MSRRGRPRIIDKELVISTLLKYKNRIVLPGDKILKQGDGVWKEISKELEGKKTFTSLHSYVCNNTDGVRDLLNDREIRQEKFQNSSAPNVNNSSSSEDSDASETNGINEPKRITISMKMSAFESLVTRKKYKNRCVCKLKPGVWQQEISERIWNETKMKCGFNYKYHHLSTDLLSGSAKGICRCKSSLDIQFEGSSERMLLHCVIIERKGMCGKRPLRQPYRSELATSLVYQSAERHRIEVANLKMSPGDPEPPTLPKADVMNVAKYEHLQSSLLDKDPIVAIAKMKRIGRTEEKLTVRNIGYDPFYVQYWTHHQNLIYEKYTKREIASLKIDATGGLVSKITRADGTLSQHIFLYLAVVNSSVGQFSVTQMLTETQDTGTLQNWLVQWRRSGAPLPKETVADASRALQTAIVRTFCGNTTIEAYCDLFFTDKLPSCYVRMDVAHFLKIYSTAMKACRATRLVRKFFMGVIGKLVLCEDVKTAREIIKEVLVVSKNETEGVLGDVTQETPCNTAKKYLMDLITGQSQLEDLIEKLEEEQLDEEYRTTTGQEKATEEESSQSNQWSVWAANIVKEIEPKIVKGLFPNAHYCEKFSEHLLADIAHLPMWSCIYRNSFGYGRIPASSAPVEGEINRLKNFDFKIKVGKIRVDRFLQEHVANLNGKMLLAHAKMNPQVEKPLEEEVKKSHDIEEEKFEENSVVDEETSVENECLNIPDQLLSEDMPENILDQVCVKDSGSSLTVQTENNGNINKNGRQKESAVKNTCVACANGDVPSGAHTCSACNTEVHILEGCSFPLIDTSEGYGEKRLCHDCHHSSSARGIVASRFEENWRGLGKSTKKQRDRASKYLNNENHLFDAINFPKNVKIPVMKNGSFACGMLIKGSETYAVKNTCAFDSVLQVLILAFAENRCLRESLKKSDNSFIQLAQYITTQGLKGAQAYRLRTKLLYELLVDDKNRIQSIDTCFILDCAIGIPYAILHAFRNVPSCEEMTKCAEGCTTLSKRRVYLMITHSNLLGENFNEVMKNCLSLQGLSCESCTSHVETTLESTGKFIFIEVQDADLLEDVKLEDIPQSFVIYVKGEERTYKLAGIIHFKRPYQQSTWNKQKKTIFTLTTKNEAGHYTAICPRPGNKWTEFDDIPAKGFPKHKTYECCPSLLIFVKVDA